MARPTRFYWDSCAWLGLLNGEDSKRRELEIIFAAAKRGSCELWTSAVSLVEVHRLAEEGGKSKPWPSANEDKIAALLEQPFVKIVPVDFETGRKARGLLRTTEGLKKRPDAIHLASALRWPVAAMHTYDRDDLIHLSGKLVAKDGNLLTICYPDETTDGPLFAASRANG